LQATISAPGSRDAFKIKHWPWEAASTGFTSTEGNAQKNDPMEKPGDEAPG
jgi:hypothetical protein